jgi:L-lactate dehydrogenase complex protein LldG
VAATTVSDAFIGALARRRATGQIVDADECVATCVAQMSTWGAGRALVPDDAWLARLGLPEAIRAAGIEIVTWPSDRGWRELLGLDDAPPTCAVTVPIGAVAERGTLLVGSSPTHGRSLDAVGWWHLAVLRADLISATLAEALGLAYAPGVAAPSAISLVSGPSRTSDVEKITTYGAHGALEEHVVVVRSSPSG